MSNRNRFIDNLVQKETNKPYNRNNKIAHKLLAQSLHNIDNPDFPLNYQNFPTDHPGYLDTDSKTRLVSMIRFSTIAYKYRFGSSLPNFYVKNTNNYPVVTSDMIGVVLAAESVT